MKHALPLLLGSLLPTSCIVQQHQLQDDWLHDYTPATEKEQQTLQQTFRNCDAVTLSKAWYRSWNRFSPKNKYWNRTLKRGPELDAILKKLASVEAWYRRSVKPSVHLDFPTGHTSITFYDSKGRRLLSENYSMYSVNYTHKTFFGSMEGLRTFFDIPDSPPEDPSTCSRR